jgi:D-alanine transaminase
VHVEDRGFQFADGVYEVTAVRGGRLVDEGPHLDRLERSLRELRIPLPMSRAALLVAMRETARRNRVRDGIVYLQVNRGAARRDHAFPAAVEPSVVITARPQSGAAGERLAASGAAVVSMPDIRWGRCDIKSVSLLPNILAKQAAKASSPRAARPMPGSSTARARSAPARWRMRS